VGEVTRTVGPPFLIGIALTVAIVSTIGLLLTHIFDQSWIGHLDSRLATSLEAHRTPRLTSLTGKGTFFADPLTVASLWALAVLVVTVVERRWRPPLFIMVAIGGEKLSYYISTLIVRRPRPPVETIGQRHVTSSFPSGHVGSSISLYAGVTLLVLALHAGRLRPRIIAITFAVGAIFAAMVGYSRMYRGHHFLTDVIVGASVGAVWVAISYRVVLRPDLEERNGRLSVDRSG
jgi:undecaprenyl-diphosphatase